MNDSSLLELRKFVAPEFVFGSGSARLAGQYAGNLGMDKALVVTDPGVIEAGWADLVLDSLKQAGVRTTVFSEVMPNPRDFEVMEGAAVFLEEGCDGIVAVGGGSPMDCAKGIGFVCTNDRHVLEFEGVDQVELPSPPLICIPTTAGSSADISQFAIINDTARKVKIAIVSKTVVPDAALIDPMTTTTMDRELTVNTGLDALTHAVEAYVSNANSPLTDLCALEAIRLISGNLARTADDLDNVLLRSKMMLGSMYAGLAFSNAILGAVHAMAHSLGGLLDLPHGECNAILLDLVMKHNFESVPERYMSIGQAMGADFPAGLSMEEQRDRVVGRVRELKREVGLSTSLGALGVTREQLAQLARSAILDPCLATNAKALSEEELRRIYEDAL